jgi:hypothetical protein
VTDEKVSKRYPPDLNDTFLAGLELRGAVALARQIKAHPEIESDC